MHLTDITQKTADVLPPAEDFGSILVRLVSASVYHPREAGQFDTFVENRFLKYVRIPRWGR